MSLFSKIKQGLPIETFSLVKAFKEDPFQNKVDVIVGSYRTEEAKPWVLPVVRTAEKALANNEKLNKEYLPILGLESFSTTATKLLLGEKNRALQENRVLSAQTISGTGALRVGAEFLARNLGLKTFYFSKPTYENHWRLFVHSGFENPREYRYLSESKHGLDLNLILEDLSNAPENSVIILHACAHNPTGYDPTEEQWKQIADVMEKRRLIPFFDCAYQGFATGDLVRDSWSVRYFIERGFEMFCAQSFSKNMGLYNERVGNLVIILKNPSEIEATKSQLVLTVRGLYLSPPSHGARIVNYVMNDPELYKEWCDNLKTMSQRIIQMRKLLRTALEELGTPGDWSHITSQIGMFSYTGLNEAQSERMLKKHHVYMLKSGRITMCGLTTSNVNYVAKAIHESITNLQI